MSIKRCLWSTQRPGDVWEFPLLQRGGKPPMDADIQHPVYKANTICYTMNPVAGSTGTSLEIVLDVGAWGDAETIELQFAFLI